MDKRRGETQQQQQQRQLAQQQQQQQPLIHCRITKDLPKVVSPFETILERDEEKEDKVTHTNDELLRLHYALGHVYFAEIRFMAMMGCMDTKLAKCKITIVHRSFH